MPRVAVALEYQTIPGNRFCLTPWLSQPAFLSSSISSSSCRSFVRSFVSSRSKRDLPVPASFRARYGGGGCGVSVARFKGSLRMGSRARAVYNG